MAGDGSQRMELMLPACCGPEDEQPMSTSGAAAKMLRARTRRVNRVVDVFFMTILNIYGRGVCALMFVALTSIAS